MSIPAVGMEQVYRTGIAENDCLCCFQVKKEAAWKSCEDDVGVVPL